MTPRERVLAAVQFRDTDIVPWHVTFTAAAHAKMVEYYGDERFEDKIGNNMAMISHRKTTEWTEIAPGHIRDEWGVVWNRTVDKDIGVIDNLVLPERSLDGWEPPDTSYPSLVDRYPGYIEANRDKFRVARLGFSLFERAWSLRGMENILVDMIEAPEFVHELLDRIVAYDLAQIDLGVAQDIDCFMLGDDWGSQNGLIMGPALWREFIKPRLKVMYGRIREGGKYVMIHCCGDVKSLFPELVECGLNIFNPFQPETMDVYQTRREYDGKLSFYGGISIQRLLPFGTPYEVRAETLKLARTLGKGGGYIASPSHAIPSDVPAENIAAMLDVLQAGVEPDRG